MTTALPRLLDELDSHRLTATFFVEGLNCELYPEAAAPRASYVARCLNCELYPEALREIIARGHELGVNGWRHEPWGELAADRERELLRRADRAFRAVGLEPSGFRPPGGVVTGQTAGLLRELQYTCWSRAAPAAPVLGLDDLTFDWDLVDAYWLMERFAELRRDRGDPGEPLGPSARPTPGPRRKGGCAYPAPLSHARRSLVGAGAPAAGADRREVGSAPAATQGETMPNPGLVRGTHHLTFCVGGAQADYELHVRLLGLKSVKKTVLFDGEIPICHLYYGGHGRRRAAGMLTKLLITPTPRSALIFAESFAAGIRSIAQIVVVLVLSALLGVALTTNSLHIIGAFAIVMLGAAFFLPVDDDRRHRAQARPLDGRRSDDHDPAVLRLQRPVPGERDAGLDFGVMVFAVLLGVATASSLVGRLAR